MQFNLDRFKRTFFRVSLPEAMFAKRVGVEDDDYGFLKNVFCYAADLLSVSRREFDG